MTWHMDCEIGKVPRGWKEEPEAGYVAVSDAVRVLHENHADYIWDGVTLVAPPVYVPPVPVWEEVKAQRIAALWQAAHDYEYLRVSGIAIGLLTIGVMQQFPKALAVAAWSANIWNTYYTRKAAVAVDITDNLDFSTCGEIPYSVPELRIELGM